jgi:hypothetical protein
LEEGMKMENGRIALSDEDLKELFSLFSSPTKHEKEQIYTENNIHYFRNLDLLEEYQLCMPKQEFAVDAWRAVLFFLHSKGYNLIKNGKVLDLSFCEEEFV